MNRPPTAPPHALSQMLRASEAAWKRRDFRQSIEILERTCRLTPEDPCVFLDLGRAHGLRYDYAAAEKCFEKAIRVSRWKPESFVAAGIHSLGFRNQTMAENYFQRAAQRDHPPISILVDLAEIYEHQHRLAEAALMVERALALNGSHPTGLLARARLNRIGGKLEEAEKVLRLLLSKPEADLNIRGRGWYELGNVLDRQARYDEAMAAFLEAKSLLRPTATQFIAKLKHEQALLTKAEKTITTEMLHRWFDFGAELQPSRPLAVLCGHPRSGTTLLEQVLDAHPGIVSAEEGVIFNEEAAQPLMRGFPEDATLLSALEPASASLLQQSRKNYFHFTEQWLGQPIGGKLLIDKNPALNPFIPALIRIFPEAKFLVAIRDPRDVCLSCFMQPLEMNPVSSGYLSLEETAAQYASVMGFWKTLQPHIKNPALEVRYEELVDDLETASRRTLDFLGVAWDERVLRFNEHAQKKAVRSPTYADVTRPVFKTAVGRWRNYEKYLAPALEKLAPFVKTFGYG